MPKSSPKPRMKPTVMREFREKTKALRPVEQRKPDGKYNRIKPVKPEV